jgi:hypothetical protein
MTTTKAVTICPSKLGTFQQHQAVVSAEDEGAEKGAVDPAPRRPSGAKTGASDLTGWLRWKFSRARPT